MVGMASICKEVGPRWQSGCDTSQLGDEIAEVASRITAAEHRLLTLIRAFDERGGWAEQGSKSCADWLSFRIGLDPVTAREKVRVARALGRLPLVDEAFRKGKLSYSKIRAITRVANEENEALLVECGFRSTGATLERVCRTYRKIVELQSDAGAPVEGTSRYVTSSETGFGWVRIEAHLPADEAALVLKALDAIRFAGNEEARKHRKEEEAPPEHEDGTPSPATGAPANSDDEGEGAAPRTVGPLEHRRQSFHRADALVALAHSALQAGEIAHPASPRFEVVMNVDAASLRGDAGPLATLDGIVGIPTDMARRVACDAAKVEVVVNDDGEVLDAGRRTRTIPPSIRRALRERDRGCRFPSCGHDRFVDGHHIVHWADGGETKLSNLVLLCRTHHRMIHEMGFSVRMTEEGPRFFDRRGRPIPEEPQMREFPAGELEMGGFLAWQQREGIGSDHEGYPLSAQRRWDFGSTIEALLERTADPTQRPG